MEASVVVCLPLRPPRPCHPEKTLNFHESARERSRTVRCAVCGVRVSPRQMSGMSGCVVSCDAVLRCGAGKVFALHTYASLVVGGLQGGHRKPNLLMGTVRALCRNAPLVWGKLHISKKMWFSNPPPPFPFACQGVRLESPRQWLGPLPWFVWTHHRAVKQGQSGGSVGTTAQGKGRECREVRIGQTGRSKALWGGKPMGTASSRQQCSQASCQSPSPCGQRSLAQTLLHTGAGKQREARPKVHWLGGGPSRQES